MKIILSGGGTGGSVAPLLAIAEELKFKKNDAEFLWIGTKKGIEKKMVQNFSFASARIKKTQIERNNTIQYKSISSGKMRRYFSFKNFIDPFLIKLGFFQSLWIIFKFNPDIILTAGGFVAVPVVWAGWILRKPVLIHQQDIEVGLANKLMTPFASIITVSLEESLKNFKSKKAKTYFTGNAIRQKISKFPLLKKERIEGWGDDPRLAKEGIGGVFNLENNLPTLLILGGGTGALSLNTFFIQILSELTKFCQIIHITGKDKTKNHISKKKKEILKRYHLHEFLNNIEDAYGAADIIITRAGMGVLSELAVLEKPAIIIPIPDGHQEDNAAYFTDKEAGILLKQDELEKKALDTIKNLLSNKEKMEKLSKNIGKIMPKDGAGKIAELILNYTNL